jgi:pimeloyl-ACP methyl ester carboxylesterase
MGLLGPATCIEPSLAQIDAGGVELAYVDQGAGEPIVFVHGVCGDWRTFDVLRPEIAARYRYVAYSRRYHRPNPWPGDGSDYSYQLHEADLVAFIEALQAGPVHLVGNSYGGAVVLLVALHHPELVRCAVANEPGSLFPHLIEGQAHAGEILAERDRSWGEMRGAARAGETDRAAELLFDWISGQTGALTRAPEGRRRRWLENARTVGLQLMQPPPPKISRATLEAIRVPVLVLRGERTIPFYVSTNEALLACLPPGNRDAVIPMAGHLSYAENPRAYADALFDFLATGGR